MVGETVDEKLKPLYVTSENEYWYYTITFLPCLNDRRVSFS
jgi:hypothetical protein